MKFAVTWKFLEPEYSLGTRIFFWDQNILLEPNYSFGTDTDTEIETEIDIDIDIETYTETDIFLSSV